MRIAPVMRSVGIDILRSNKREAGTGRKLFILRKIKGNSLFENGLSVGVNVCDRRGDFCDREDPRPYWTVWTLWPWKVYGHTYAQGITY